jgi:citrate synthase
VASDKLIIRDGDTETEFDIVVGSEGNRGVDLGTLRARTGLVALDLGFANTAGCRSGVSYVDDNAGELRYRGYPIDQLAERSSFTEVAYLLFHGELPSLGELEDFRERIADNALIDEDMKKLLEALPRQAHPMGVLSSAMLAMATFYPELQYVENPEVAELSAIYLLAKVPTIAAFAFKRSMGQPYAYPKSSLDYAARFLHMMFALPTEDYEFDPVVARALDVLLILHADHGQNCSTSTVRLVGSGRANLFASISSGINALWGPLHGGANQNVVEMLSEIHESGGDYMKHIERAQDRDDPFRLWGFGHRMYKTYDPRALILKAFAHDVIDRLGQDDPLLELALNLEEAALTQDYFIERNLYPNVDFYSGIMFRALGFPPRLFTVLFAMGRLPGWMAQWREQLVDPTTRLGRPRQIYSGPKRRDYPVVHER